MTASEPDQGRILRECQDHHAPLVAYAVIKRDRDLVEELLGGLGLQELRTLVVVLADAHPTPLIRAADGVHDPVTVRRFVNGELLPLSRSERLAVIHEMHRKDIALRKIADRLCLSFETTRRMLDKPLPQEDESGALSLGAVA